MKADILKDRVKWISQNLKGKTIKKVEVGEFSDESPFYSVWIRFKDGSRCKIGTDYKDGFRFWDK